MSTERGAAQYIRMSTDTQNLSPAIQRQAIEEYARAAGLAVIATYEDEGRSGLTLRHRAGMRRLLADVTAADRPFSVLLVYDVSRWGRFQDTDESAYYEYHCRMHGVDVVYVKEAFQQDQTPLSTLMKTLRRAMAAEFSRELAVKVHEAQRRAISLGFQIGRTPCIGIDRMAVAEDGSSRYLQHRERARKGEHITWVLGPEHERALVRRIFDDYANSDITLAALAVRLNEDGLLARGRAFTLTMVRSLINCEIFVGEFTWGRHKSRGRKRRRSDDDPALVRAPGVVEPVIDRATWDKAHRKRDLATHVFDRSPAELLADLRAALRSNPGLTATEIRGHHCAPIAKYREKFGSMREAMRLAGREVTALRGAYRERKSRTHRFSSQFRRDLGQLMTREGLRWEARDHEHAFSIEASLKVRFRLIWQRPHRQGPRWHFQKGRLEAYDRMLFVLMQEDGTANEFLVLTPVEYHGLRTWFAINESPGTRICSGSHLMAYLRDAAATTARKDVEYSDS